ncbi:MAG: hypothetical protein ABSD20_19230 [Terriglobales bacterium]|jgi:hypothetical protein
MIIAKGVRAAEIADVGDDTRHLAKRRIDSTGSLSSPAGCFMGGVVFLIVDHVHVKEA